MSGGGGRFVGRAFNTAFSRSLASAAAAAAKKRCCVACSIREAEIPMMLSQLAYMVNDQSDFSNTVFGYMVISTKPWNRNPDLEGR